jgi:putative glutamine amidotransferase
VQRPRILVTLDTGEELRRGVPLPSVQMKAAYATAIEQAGGTPIAAAPTADADVIADLASIMDGLVVTGGAFDISPSEYGGAVEESVRLDPAKPLRTSFETALLQAALARALPILGVCGGMQLLNVVLGGTLIQDINAAVEDPLEHEQPTSPLGTHHSIAFVQKTALHRAVQVDVADVNSTHHQAVEKLGRGLVALAKSSDGVIEAIGLPSDLALLGVQWHPELLNDDVSRRIYGALVEQTNQTIRRSGVR